MFRMIIQDISFQYIGIHIHMVLVTCIQVFIISKRNKNKSNLITPYMHNHLLAFNVLRCAHFLCCWTPCRKQCALSNVNDPSVYNHYHKRLFHIVEDSTRGFNLNINLFNNTNSFLRQVDGDFIYGSRLLKTIFAWIIYANEK